MVKIKHSVWISQTLVFIGIVALLVFGISPVGRASAAEPGCYAVSTSTSSSNAVVENTTNATCPNNEIQSQVDSDQKCFVTQVSSGGQTAYSERDCQTIAVGDETIDTSVTPEVEDVSAVSVDLDGEGVELEGEYYCGKGDKKVRVSFNIGCLGEDYSESEYNPVLDMLFALLRFVSVGVGIVVTGSIVWAGIQYSASRGNPQGTEAALKRVSNSVIALLIYIFSFAILNVIVPGGLFLR